MTSEARTVVVLGASPKPERFANRAVLALGRHGHRVIPVYPRGGEIGGWPVATALAEVRGPVDTLALYMGPRRSEPVIPDIVALAPRRVVLNPGTESPALEAALDRADIPWVHDCVLRMLDGERF